MPSVEALHAYCLRHIPNRMREFREQMSAMARGAILDLGCGRTAPLLRQLAGLRVGIDPVSDLQATPGLHLLRAVAEHLPFADESFDVVYSTSVFEHLEHPSAVVSEIARVLKPGGVCHVLTPNKWDYVSVGARLIPNRFHATVVYALTGRAEMDTFPTRYRMNSRRDIRRVAAGARLTVDDLQFQRHIPHYLKRHWSLYVIGLLMEQLQRVLPPLRPWIRFTLRKSS